MELWVAGFNAFNQLQFEGQLPEEPQDIHEFRPVLQNEVIEILGTSISATLVRTSSSVLIAGLADEFLRSSACMEGIAVAGNGKVSECKSGSVIQYSSVEKYTEKNGENLGELGDFRCIVTNQTTFTALSSDGKVWTWGDGRYEACIGRDATEESPATSPGIVEELDGLPTGPIVKIASGGYITAALTEGSDLYIWGGHPGHPKLFDQLSGRPEPLDLDGHDFIDIAIGNDHMMLLTTDHRVFVVGVGNSGQLGMIAEKLTEWTEISLPLNVGQRAVGVHAGYKTSFVLVKCIA